MELLVWGWFALYRNWKEASFWKVIKIKKVRFHITIVLEISGFSSAFGLSFPFQKRSFTHEEN